MASLGRQDSGALLPKSNLGDLSPWPEPTARVISPSQCDPRTVISDQRGPVLLGEVCGSARTARQPLVSFKETSLTFECHYLRGCLREESRVFKSVFPQCGLWSLACCPGTVVSGFFTIPLVSLRYPCGKGSLSHRGGSQLPLRGHGDGTEADQHQHPGSSPETGTPTCASSLYLLSRMISLEIGNCFGFNLKYI